MEVDKENENSASNANRFGFKGPRATLKTLNANRFGFVAKPASKQVLKKPRTAAYRPDAKAGEQADADSLQPESWAVLNRPDQSPPYKVVPGNRVDQASAHRGEQGDSSNNDDSLEADNFLAALVGMPDLGESLCLEDDLLDFMVPHSKDSELKDLCNEPAAKACSQQELPVKAVPFAARPSKTKNLSELKQTKERIQSERDECLSKIMQLHRLAEKHTGADSESEHQGFWRELGVVLETP